jgi:hypothetical protein
MISRSNAMVFQFIDVWVARLVEALPRIAGAAIILLIGWVAGRAIGRGAAKVFDKAGLAGALRWTALGKTLDKSKVRIVGFFEVGIRWFIYLLAVLGAADVLQVQSLSNFVYSVVEYIPSLLGGVFLILIGFIVADFIGDALISVSREANVEYGATFGNGLKVILYFVVIIIGLSVMKIDVTVLDTIVTALSWGVAAGVGVGLGIALGWGLKDVITEEARIWLKTKRSKNSDT